MAEQRRRPGRPSKLNEETKKALLRGVQAGLPYVLVCANAGVHYNTLRNWIKRGEKAKSGEYLDFLEELKGAEAAGALANIATIFRSGQEGHWQAAAWILERRHPEVYGRRVAAEITGKEGGPVRQEVSHMSADKSAERERRFAELYEQLDARRAELDGANPGGV